MSEKIAIQIKGLKKQYRLGQIGGGTLTADLQSWWARLRHKEDPNSKIGSEQRLIGQTFMALNGIDLTIKQGEAIGIIGGNGAGKSTMLKILSRITAPTEGSVDIYGRIASMLEVGTGFSPEMTGRENVYLNGAILGMTKAEIDAKMEDIIEFSEVRDFIDTPVKRYSSGMYVKLAFSVAAHLDSEIMIMDEVLAVGDMAFQKKCLDKMRSAATTEGKTVLYVSHNMNTIRQLCDRCVVLDKGRIIFDGDVEEAIAIYMGADGQADRVYDYSKIKHRSKAKETIMLSFCEILNETAAAYIPGTKLNLKLGLSARRIGENLRLRMEVSYKDGTMAATAFTGDISGEIALGENVLNMVFDTSGLVSGEYSVEMCAYEITSEGQEFVLDDVTPAFRFVLDDETNEDKPVWLHQWWGHIRLNDVQLEDKG